MKKPRDQRGFESKLRLELSPHYFAAAASSFFAQSAHPPFFVAHSVPEQADFSAFAAPQPQFSWLCALCAQEAKPKTKTDDSKSIFMEPILQNSEL
ncbi:hypothetical protein ACES2I_08255 [Bdellovibrio bacteriovorus]|uniref:hypothetical protein n=1 Tax=Bdellovibrio bacteriovorus TaxID=959 RepID=UPI0035A6FED4